MINSKKFTFNPVAVNAYLLWDETKEAVLIDPACFYPEEEKELERFVEAQELKIVRLLNTHGHFDHLMGNSFAERRWGLKCRIHPGDAPMVDQARQHALLFGITMQNPSSDVELLAEGDEIHFGATALKVIHVPGHSPGGVAFYGAQDQILVVGDILFNGSVGRTDLPGGNHNQLITGIKEKLLTLGDEVKVYPGHGDETTIGWEKRTNPFLR
ncbi:MAG: MBL fold metallo-hydrolase [Bacteroidetes bacterium]|nr:MBL fold metallo-hydrolase [Bacteroidota bacterium]MCL6101841.1 MBL fold metallo-hydrolase [Bacteroidota bacterium]